MAAVRLAIASIVSQTIPAQQWKELIWTKEISRCAETIKKYG